MAGVKAVALKCGTGMIPDPQAARALITPRTRAIVPVHYAGVSCEMDRILDIARRYQLLVIYHLGR